MSTGLRRRPEEYLKYFQNGSSAASQKAGYYQGPSCHTGLSDHSRSRFFRPGGFQAAQWKFVDLWRKAAAFFLGEQYIRCWGVGSLLRRKRVTRWRPLGIRCCLVGSLFRLGETRQRRIRQSRRMEAGLAELIGKNLHPRTFDGRT